MPLISVEISDEVDIEVYCECGNGLCNTTSVERRCGSDAFVVEPCEDCSVSKRSEGYDDGHGDGYAEGHTAGYDEGYQAGLGETK